MQLNRVVPLALGAVLSLAPRPVKAAASVKLQVPEGVTTLKGILACSSLGLGPHFCSSGPFQAVAKRLNMGIAFLSGDNTLASYDNRCTGGEFKALVDSIAAAGKAAGHPEAANAPIVGCGHSHGGDYWIYFNACMPERMAAVFVKSSGGVQYEGAALKTPMIWEIGTNDLQDHIGPRHYRGQMFTYRPKGMALSLVMGAGEGHNDWSGASETMVAALIEGIFKLRVPETADPSKGPVTLNYIDETSGKYWLGNNYTKAVSAWAMSPDKDKLYNTSFLPTEEIAKMWMGAGAPLPAAMKVETNGVCSGCYAHPASEPPGAPMPGTPMPGPTQPPGSSLDAGAALDSGSVSPMADAASGATSPPTNTPVPETQRMDAAAKPGRAVSEPSGPSEEESRPKPAANKNSGGCTMGGGISGSSAVALALALLALAQSLRRRATARAGRRPQS